MEDTGLRIETPERIDLSLEPAGVGSRFVAQVIDEVYKWAILIIIGLVFLLLTILTNIKAIHSSFLTYLVIALAVIIFFLIYFGFDIYFEARHNGQTPGKKKTGIRVIKDGGYPLDLNSVVIRNLVGIVDMLPFYYLLGFVVIMLNKKQQRLGDMAAGTLVIRERISRIPYNPFSSKKYSELTEHLYTFLPTQLALLTAQDDFIVKNYFQRRFQMDQQASRKLARDMVNTYLKKMQIDLPEFKDSPSAIRFLEELYMARQEFSKHHQ